MQGRIATRIDGRVGTTKALLKCHGPLSTEDEKDEQWRLVGLESGDLRLTKAFDQFLQSDSYSKD